MNRWTTLYWTQTGCTRVLNKVPSVFLLNLQQWKSRHVLYVKCVRCCDVSPVVVSVRKGPRHGGPRQTLFNSDVTTSRLGGEKEGGIWNGRTHRSAKLFDKGPKKEPVDDHRVWLPNQSRHSWLNSVSSSSFFSKQINEPGGSVTTEHESAAGRCHSQKGRNLSIQDIKQVPTLLSISALKKFVLELTQTCGRIPTLTGTNSCVCHHGFHHVHRVHHDLPLGNKMTVADIQITVVSFIICVCLLIQYKLYTRLWEEFFFLYERRLYLKWSICKIEFELSVVL